jgi:hypothetical protein
VDEANLRISVHICIYALVNIEVVIIFKIN